MKFYRTDLELPKDVPVVAKVEYYVKSQYGNERVYLKDPIMAAAVYDLTGTKTLLPMHITALKVLGFSLVESLPEREVKE